MSTYNQFIERIDKLEEKIEAYEQEASECASLKREIDNANSLKSQLFEKYHKKYGIINTVENQRYSLQELAQIRAELADTSFLTLLKRFLGIGKKNDEIYADLMGKIRGLLNYLNEQLQEHEQSMKIVGTAIEHLAAEYEKAYMQVLEASGCTAETEWGRYQQPTEVAGNLYLGDIDISLETELRYSKACMAKQMKLSYSDSGVTSGIVRVPYTRSLQEPIHFLYEHKADTALQAVQSVRSLIYQIVRMTPAYYMELHLMDGEKTGADFAELMNLQKVMDGELINLNKRATGGSYKLAQTYLENKNISDGLKKLDQYISRVAEEMGGFESIQAYNAANQDINSGKGIIPYQIVVIDNFPTGFTDEDMKLLDKLVKNGAQRGVSIILMNNQDTWLEMQRKNPHSNNHTFQDKVSKEAYATFDRITLDKNAMEQKIARLAATDCSSTCRLQMKLKGNPDYINSVVSVKNAVAETDNYFPHIIDPETPFGRLDSMKGLRIPFALDRKGHIMEYCLGEAMNAHGLICGGTGSGKSTLLHMLITSIVMNYSPSDVEIWLADYKITEFYSYKTNTPPHIRFIGLSKTSDFSYAFIDKITAEMERRQEIIAEADVALKREGKEINVTNFNDYREIFGVDSLRRLIIIIDEFHVMAQHAQKEPEYKEKLENLLAEARALGIILLFSDQAIVDGLRGLSEKGKKQIKARIALSNYEDELKETLNEKDRDKLRPFLNMKTGEVAVQTVTEERDEDGVLKEVTHIERGMGIYIDGKWRFEMNKRARKLYQAEDYVSDSFDDKVVEAVNWESINEWEKTGLKPRRHGDKDMHIYLGRPLDLQFSMHFPLLQRKGSNIMSIGGSEEQQMQILKAVTESFVRQQDYNIVVMTDKFASLYREYDEDIQRLADDTLNMSVYEDLEDICYQINVLLKTVNNRANTTKTLVIWLGLDIIADLLNEESSRKPEVLEKLADESSGKNGKNKKSSNETIGASKAQADLESMFDSLFGGDDFSFDAGLEDEDPYAEEENKDEADDESYLYNACDDIEKIIHIGPSRNVYNLVIYDTAAALKDFRGARTSDFGHKIAFAMSDNDASDFLERSNLVRTLPVTMAFYYDGRSGKRFIPYKL